MFTYLNYVYLVLYYTLGNNFDTYKLNIPTQHSK